MDELVHIKQAVEVDETLLVVDAMAGQEAVNVAKTFNEKVGISGVILTKTDGDTRGGAALSVLALPIFRPRYITQKRLRSRAGEMCIRDRTSSWMSWCALSRRSRSMKLCWSWMPWPVRKPSTWQRPSMLSLIHIFDFVPADIWAEQRQKALSEVRKDAAFEGIGYDRCV